ncbi:uncharacterized protein MELLADRAFT_89499 [Melampsora larici-populina 98AG31]|uniref:Tet-like 2OG-Fe(II) oxygenase domain-containing protein n=1 Tax=Melampsora larici-populina (strain 98AG31 / pathotype 3-4-7) TaxID=747676 RepID=F4RTK4_MELLP|nr:uncharacterized protein MELLADRAFT_89499 [Melampsora larici-populina 98AG31]EGG04323.1 hypothetical protein MELLADRAFT_89499 [Melampsora larici-populina 98AG31]
MPKQKSQSTIRARAKRTVEKNKKNSLHPLLNARAAKKAKLTKEYGLPADSKFLFFKKGRKYGRPRFRLTYGTVVCLDADTSELLLIARFNERNESNKKLFALFDHAISTAYTHSTARNLIDINGASYKEKRRSRKYGKMYAFGMRAGFEKECLALTASYSWNEQTSRDLAKMQEDLECQENLLEIENFFAERFSGLSSYAFQSNADLAKATNAPSWAGESFYVSPNATVFSSNVTVTFDQFTNKKHKDRDATEYAFGFFSLIDRKTGGLYERGPSAPRGNVLGSCFVLDDYNLEVDLDACDGVIELLWRTKVHHRTTPSKTFNARKEVIAPELAEVRRFACSVQISQALVDRISKVYEMREGMTSEKWVEYRDSKLHGWGFEARKKMKALAIKHGVWDDSF